jgi:hypothetical protein
MSSSYIVHRQDRRATIYRNTHRSWFQFESATCSDFKGFTAVAFSHHPRDMMADRKSEAFPQCPKNIGRIRSVTIRSLSNSSPSGSISLRPCRFRGDVGRRQGSCQNTHRSSNKRRLLAMNAKVPFEMPPGIHLDNQIIAESGLNGRSHMDLLINA